MDYESMKALTGAIVLSSDEDDSDLEIQPALNAEIHVSPKEVLVNLHPETLEEVTISFVFFIDLPKQGLPPTSLASKIHIGSECMEFLNVNIRKSR